MAHVPRCDDGSGFKTERVALVIEHFLVRYGGQVELVKLLEVCPEIRNLLAGRRLQPFLEGYPERFAVTRDEGDEKRCSVRMLRTDVGDEPPADVKQYIVFAHSAYYTRELHAHVRRGMVLYQGKQKTEATPLRWLCAHKSIPKYLKGYVANHPVAAWQYHRRPDLGGFETERDARYQSVMRHFRKFVEDSEVLQFADEAGDTVRVRAGLPAEEPPAAAAAAAAAAGPDGAGRAAPQKEPLKKRRRVGPGAIVDTDVSSARVEVASGELAGGLLLVTRVSSRTRDVNRLELRMMAAWAGLAEAPRELRSGLWYHGGGTEEGAGRRLLECARLHATSVRRCCRVVCAADDVDTLVARVADAALGRGDRRFRVAFDMHFPEAASATLPFCDMTHHAALLARVYGAIGLDRCDAGGGAAGTATPLVVVCVKDLYVLAEEIGPAERPAEGFLQRWETRPFIFTGAMESSVAVAVASVGRVAAALEAGRGGRAAEDGPLPCVDLVVDCCCGSGTLSAASATLGARRVLGLELRDEFVSRIAENLLHCGLLGEGSAVRAIGQDCTKPCEDAVLRPAAAGGAAVVPSLVFCNAPWGKKFGTEEDCVSVISGVLRNYSASVICFVVPKHVLEKVREASPVRVIACVPIGSIHLVVVKAVSAAEAAAAAAAAATAVAEGCDNDGEAES